MPWSIEQKGNRFCVMDKAGKQLKCYPDKSKAEAYKKTLTASANKEFESIEQVMLENGPVIVGVAATNIPHLPLPPAGVVEVDGKKKIRVPFIRSGIFRHPVHGNMVFTEKVLDKMLENHNAGKSHYGVNYKARHEDSKAIAWFDKERGGYIAKEHSPEFGTMLVGYGDPTSQAALDTIANREYVFASVEFRPNHKDVMVSQLSALDMNEITLEELVLTISKEVDLEENVMEEVTISVEEFDALKAKADEVEAAKVALSEQIEKVTQLEVALEEAKAVVVVDEYESLPDNVKVVLEEQKKEIRRLKEGALESQVQLVIAKAETYRDDNGYGHSPVLLEIAKNAMIGNPVGQEDGLIKLESYEPADVADYFRKIFVHMLETVPGQVKLEGVTEADDSHSVDFSSKESFKTEDLKSFWVKNL